MNVHQNQILAYRGLIDAQSVLCHPGKELSILTPPVKEIVFSCNLEKVWEMVRNSGYLLKNRPVR